MKSPELIIRCYAKQTSGYWVAICVDLCLAAQADTFDIAKRKLEEQICAYVEEALTVDKEFAGELLTRKAPIGQRIEYALIVAAHRFHLIKNGIRRSFNTILPVHVGPNCHA